MDELKLYIHGELVEATSNETFDNINPATGEVISKIQVASKADVDRAVESARDGFRVWSRMTGAQRGRILMNAVAAAARAQRRAGAPRSAGYRQADLRGAAWSTWRPAPTAIEYFAGAAPTLHGEHDDLGAAFAYTRREPLGVCAGIGAWNYPIQIACWKSAPCPRLRQRHGVQAGAS